MAETSSQAQQPATAVETSLPAEPHAKETQANTAPVTGATQNEMTDPVRNQNNAQETLLSISEMLEENATRLRKEEKGKKVLLDWEFIFNRFGQAPNLNLVLPSEQEPGVNHWKPDENTLASWKAYRTEQPTPAGQIWWKIDTTKPDLLSFKSKYRDHRYMPIDNAVLLIEFLLKGGFSDDAFDPVRISDILFIQQNMFVFIFSYAKPSYRSATTSRCKLEVSRLPVTQFGGHCLPLINVLHLQYHLVYLMYMDKRQRRSARESLPEDRPGLILERHSAKIRQLSHSRTPGTPSSCQTSQQNPDYVLAEEYFEEFRLSMSLYLYGEGGEFQLLLLGDSGAHVDLHTYLSFEERHSTLSLRFDQNSLGKLAGLTHFLANLVHLMDTWYNGWKETLNRIDGIVGFEMDHTFDDRQLESHIFDTSDSMDLSKQYFTTLQILRIARQQIENNRIGWEEFRELPDTELYRGQLHKSSPTHDRVLSTLDKFVLSEGGERIFAIWEEQRDRVTQLFKTRAKRLTERIDQKTKEVESLRDGLFNATSLREAMKGMALNRAIYLFTAVTIIFTPLSFLTALWALPILNTTPEGGSVRPSSRAFLATFIIIPVLTYVVCGYFAWYLVSTKTWKTCANFFPRLLENVHFVLDVGAKYALYPFSKSTQKACKDYVQYPPENTPAWVLKAIKWLVGAGEDSSEPATA